MKGGKQQSCGGLSMLKEWRERSCEKELESNRRRGRPKRRWMDRVKGYSSDRGLTMIHGEAGCMETVKTVNVFYLLRSGI